MEVKADQAPLLNEKIDDYNDWVDKELKEWVSEAKVDHKIPSDFISKHLSEWRNGEHDVKGDILHLRARVQSELNKFGSNRIERLCHAIWLRVTNQDHELFETYNTYDAILTGLNDLEKKEEAWCRRTSNIRNNIRLLNNRYSDSSNEDFKLLRNEKFRAESKEFMESVLKFEGAAPALKINYFCDKLNKFGNDWLGSKAGSDEVKELLLNFILVSQDNNGEFLKLIQLLSDQEGPFSLKAIENAYDDKKFDEYGFNSAVISHIMDKDLELTKECSIDEFNRFVADKDAKFKFWFKEKVVLSIYQSDKSFNSTLIKRNSKRGGEADEVEYKALIEKYFEKIDRTDENNQGKIAELSLGMFFNELEVNIAQIRSFNELYDSLSDNKYFENVVNDDKEKRFKNEQETETIQLITNLPSKEQLSIDDTFRTASEAFAKSILQLEEELRTDPLLAFLKIKKIIDVFTNSLKGTDMSTKELLRTSIILEGNRVQIFVILNKLKIYLNKVSVRDEKINEIINKMDLKVESNDEKLESIKKEIDQMNKIGFLTPYEAKKRKKEIEQKRREIEDIKGREAKERRDLVGREINEARKLYRVFFGEFQKIINPSKSEEAEESVESGS